MVRNLQGGVRKTYFVLKNLTIHLFCISVPTLCVPEANLFQTEALETHITRFADINVQHNTFCFYIPVLYEYVQQLRFSQQ
jgi:hypothetical protein